MTLSADGGRSALTHTKTHTHTHTHTHTDKTKLAEKALRAKQKFSWRASKKRKNGKKNTST